MREIRPRSPAQSGDAGGAQDIFERDSERESRRSKRRGTSPARPRYPQRTDATSAEISGEGTGTGATAAIANSVASNEVSDPFESEVSPPARSLKSRAIGYLSRREYSRIELARKLSPYLEETDDLEALLDSLESGNWLSDARFAQSLVHRRASRQGASRIVGELKRNSVDPELVATFDAQLRDTEWARAEAVWRKKFGALPATPAERGKQARFLAMRGFSHAIIARLLKGQGADEESVFFDEPPID
ncbi:recombination regulator RecX [Burkholderia sp. L27(2015)]|uniref:recombination regulator RecX n=1 Tax=Burkholderia sp. L27(2015) TaxID=1641858 RepID=UPI00131AA9BC|nr:recombination regulator RecX [Burkholderia sp. L27(2015)]